MVKDILKILFFVLLFGTICNGQISVSAAVEDGMIYAGDSFIYQIVIDGSSQEGKPDTAALSQWQPVYAGGQNASSSMITIVNGKKNVQESQKFVMNYKLTALNEGRFVIGSVPVEVQGQLFNTNPVEIEVVKAGKTDKMLIKASLSSTACYVGQPLVLTIEWTIMADVGEYNFSIPAFLRDDIILDDVSNWQEPSASKAGTLNVNGVEIAAVQKQTVMYGARAIAIILKKVIIPQKEGAINLGKIGVVADIAFVSNQRQRGNDPFEDFFGRQKEYRKFTCETDELVITVNALPEDGKPVDFYGLVGSYDIDATAEAKETTPDGKIKVAVGEPITLTIKIGGNEYLNSIKTPNLSTIKPLAENFIIPSEQSPPTVEGNYKVFVQTIRANNSKITEIPPISISYFDIDKSKYITKSTNPIRLEIMETTKLTDFSVTGNSDKTAKELERVKEGLSANYETYDALANQHFTAADILIKSRYGLLWQLPFVFMAAAGFKRVISANRQTRKIRAVKRAAAKKAMKELKSLKESDCQQLGEILRNYIGQRFDRQAGTLTSQDCRNIIIENTDDTNTANEFAELLGRAEAGKYSSMSITVNKDTIQTAKKLLDTIETKGRDK